MSLMTVFMESLLDWMKTGFDLSVYSFLIFVPILILVSIVNKFKKLNKEFHIENEMIANMIKTRRALVGKTNAEIETILNSGSVGIVKVYNRKIVSINNHGAKIFGYSKEELINQSSSIVHLTPESEASFLKLIVDNESNGVVPELEHDFRAKDGTVKHLRGAGEMYRINGQISDLIWFYFDAKDLIDFKKLNEELQFAYKQDFSLPISAIIEFASQIVNDHQSCLCNKSVCEEIINNSNMLQKQLYNSLDMFKLENGLYRVSKTSFKLVDLIEKEIIEFKNENPSKDIFLSVNSFDRDHSVNYDYQLVKMLFYNILSHVINVEENSVLKFNISAHSGVWVEFQFRQIDENIYIEHIFDKLDVNEELNDYNIFIYKFINISNELNLDSRLESLGDKKYKISYKF
jgi:PAS domain S-box-containing protein